MRKIVFTLMIIIMLVSLVTITYAQDPTGTPTAEPSGTPMVTVTPTVSATPTDEPEPTQAATETPTPIPPTATPEPLGYGSTVLSFQDLNLDARILRSPFDQTSYLFSLPGDWELLEGALLEISLEGLLQEDSPLSDEMNTSGLLTIEFNEIPIDTIPVDWRQNQVLNFQIPVEAITPIRDDGRHILSLRLDTGLDCTSVSSGAIVAPESLFHFVHQYVAPSTSLEELPRPIFQRSFIPDSAIIVIPETPTADELQAALTIGAGFGKNSFGNLIMTLVPVNQLTPEQQASEHLIVVGKLASLELLNEAQPTSSSLDSESPLDSAQTDDGLIWMVVSPWNASKVVLAITGNTDDAVVKAAQAASSNQIRTTEDNNLSIVSSVQPLLDTTLPVLSVRQTLAGNGFAPQVFRDVGTEDFEFEFRLQPNLEANVNTFFELILSHSMLLDYTRSGVVILLNEIPIGSVRLSDQTAAFTTVRFPLPSSVLRPGVNRIRIEAELRPTSECYSRDTAVAWLTIHDDSSVNLSLEEASTSGFLPSADLANYPNPFVHDSTLSDVAFVLPANEPNAWNTALQIAKDLGDEAEGIFMGLEVALTNDLPEDILNNYHLLIVGRPSTLPVLNVLENELPLPFIAGTNTAIEENLQITYRLSPDENVGYIELLPSPFNQRQFIIAVLGTTDEAVQSAGLTLSTQDLRRDLVGNLSIIDGSQIVSQTVRPVVLESVDTTNPEVFDPNEGIEDAEATRPDWIPTVFTASMVLTFAILLFVTLTSGTRVVQEQIQRSKTITLDVPFPVDFVDYRFTDDLRGSLTRIRSLDPQAVIWAEGFLISKSPGLAQDELVPAESLIVFTAPHSQQSFRDAVVKVRPKRIYLLAEMPPVNHFDEFQQALKRLLEAGLARTEGDISLKQLSTALAQPKENVRLGLEYLQAMGTISVTWGNNNDDYAKVSLQNGETTNQAEKVKVKTEKGLNTVYEYRQFIRKARLPE